MSMSGADEIQIKREMKGNVCALIVSKRGFYKHIRTQHHINAIVKRRPLKISAIGTEKEERIIVPPPREGSKHSRVQLERKRAFCLSHRGRVDHRLGIQ